MNGALCTSHARRITSGESDEEELQTNYYFRLRYLLSLFFFFDVSQKVERYLTASSGNVSASFEKLRSGDDGPVPFLLLYVFCFLYLFVGETSPRRFVTPGGYGD